MNSIVVFAYSLIGHDCLNYLIGRGYNIKAVVTHQDNPLEIQWFPSVENLAKQHKIPVFVDNPNTPEFIERLRALNPTLILSAYYRQMICQEILDIPSKGAFNMHGSYLPHYRGRCPANWVLVKGETTSGATLHRMVKAADAGDIAAQRAFEITPHDNAMDVTLKIRDTALIILEETLDSLLEGKIPLIPQDLTAGSYFGGRSAKDAIVDWSQSALNIYNLIRSQLPFPQFPAGLTSYLTHEVRLKGALRPTELTVKHTSLPGTILGLSPLKIACNDGEVIEITDYDSPVELEVGRRLGY